MKRRTFLSLFLLFAIGISFGQTTRAVVVGISDYEHPQMVDLDFAHLDAIAFANYLVSEEGRQLPKEQIVLLTASAATQAKILSAIQWLVEQSAPGDEAIFYFAGMSDRGRIDEEQNKEYFLPYDGTFNDHQTAIDFEFLDQVFTTLIQKEVVLKIVWDAVIFYEGSILTKQIADEVRLFSNQPGGLSYEVSNFGHGVFTHFLLMGLCGAADKDGDGTISLLELRNYLEDEVLKEMSFADVYPLVIGDLSTTMGIVGKDVDPSAFYEKLNVKDFLEVKDRGPIKKEEDGPDIEIRFPDLPKNHAFVTKAEKLTMEIEVRNELSTLLINDQKIDRPAMETHTFELELKQGMNEFKVAAFKGIQSRVDTILVFSRMGPSLRWELGEKLSHHALLIATDEYDDPGWQKLNNPVFDARGLARVLSENYGFEVDTLLNATADEILIKLREYAIRFNRDNYLEDDAHLLIFFAGHGNWDPFLKQGYLVAKDSRLDDASFRSYLSFADLQNKIDNINVKHIFVMLDVCYGGSFDLSLASQGTRSGGASPYRTISASKYKSKVLQPQTRRFLSAGQLVEVLDGYANQHSPMMRSLLNLLENPEDPILTVEDLQLAIKNLDPTPHAGTFGKNEAGSNFLFLRER